MRHGEFKDRIYGQFARIGTALASQRRLELLDLLAQAPRSVEGLASEASMSVANTSRHLQALKAARLVETERQGTKVIHRLAGDDILRLWLALRTVAETRLAEVPRIVGDHAADGAGEHVMGRDELTEALRSDAVVIVDVRPAVEFAHGHLPGAVSVPLEEVAGAIGRLPRNARIVVYCRGRYCQFADEALAVLRRAGLDAVRLEGGWPEWVGEGRPTAS